jgi:predicted lactoylglutathione lyase
MNAQNVSVTLIVKDLEKSLEFYSKLGMYIHGVTDISFVCSVGGSEVAFMRQDAFKELADPIEVTASRSKKSMKGLITCAVSYKSEVEFMLDKAKEEKCDVTLPKQSDRRYHGFFRDIDGYVWEVYWQNNQK